MQDLRTHDLAWSDGIYRILGLEPGSVEPGPEAFLARVHPGDRARLAGLAAPVERELEVLQPAAEGNSGPQIAEHFS